MNKEERHDADESSIPLQTAPGLYRLLPPALPGDKIAADGLDILMFLANNPAHNTARDIVEIRGIKANLVSVNVDKLVHEGYIERAAVPGDRRKTYLTCTKKASPLIERGHKIQAVFFQELLQTIDPDELNTFHRVFCAIDKNLDKMMKPASAKTIEK